MVVGERHGRIQHGCGGRSVIHVAILIGAVKQLMRQTVRGLTQKGFVECLHVGVLVRTLDRQGFIHLVDRGLTRRQTLNPRRTARGATPSDATPSPPII